MVSGVFKDLSHENRQTMKIPDNLCYAGLAIKSARNFCRKAEIIKSCRFHINSCRFNKSCIFYAAGTDTQAFPHRQNIHSSIIRSISSSLPFFSYGKSLYMNLETTQDILPQS